MELTDKLKLEFAVNLGLPVDFAGKMLELQSTNTDRILKDLYIKRRQELDQLDEMGSTEKQEFYDSMKQQVQDAEISALLSATKAR